jgi:hypothetical protein
VVNAPIVRRDIAVVKKEALLHYYKSASGTLQEGMLNLHLLKLVTGVEISTREVIRSGRPGKPVKRRSRTAAAAPNSAAFLLSMLIAGGVFGAKERSSIAL